MAAVAAATVGGVCMATFSCSGIGEIAVKFEKLAKGSDAACQKAVKAGADVLKAELAMAAPYDTGALARSIKAGAVKYDAGDGWVSEVKPVGENHGENLAKIGNILAYGRSNMAPRPWFNSTIMAARGKVESAMRSAFEEAQKG